MYAVSRCVRRGFLQSSLPIYFVTAVFVYKKRFVFVQGPTRIRKGITASFFYRGATCYIKGREA